MAEHGGIPPNAPDGGLARPTVMLDTPMPCDTHLKWWEITRRYLNVPVFFLDEPIASSADYFREDAKEHYVRYQVDQYRRLIEFLEKLLCRKFDWDKFEEMDRTVVKVTQIFHDACEFRKAIPCPMPTEDMMNIFVPSFMMRGNPETLDFYRGLYDELKYRAENKIGVIPEEKYRLIWGPGLPPWHTMEIFNWFEDQGAVFVFDLSYRSPDEPPEVPESITDPLERMVLRQYLSRRVAIERSVVGGYNFIHSENPLEWIEPFHADGVVFHWLKSCRHTTIGNRYYMNLIQEHSGVPTLFLESDICDVREYFEADWHVKILAFLETVDAYKERKKKESP
jgi:benzoyl-CoA reductase/2-hydroxyglutaryl-CoA dehydratase subunit BcrC/BadD/HgdB